MTRSFKKPKLSVQDADHFANDMLERKPAIENLSLLLSNISSPIVLSVNAPWGAGKTTFLQMLHSDLKNKQCKSVYFSAWETDFANDPLLAFLGEMNTALQGYIVGDKKKSKAWSTAKKAGTHILKRAVPVILKVGTAGLLDADKIIEDEASDFIESLSKDAIDEYAKSKIAIQSFKENIGRVLLDDEGEISNLYIFVDELDRCRPTYSIELLERIKHLLDIEGLVFILAMDKQQLAHSVRGVYGAEFDALGYLKRFIDIEYSLPQASLNNFIEGVYSSFGFDKIFARRAHQELQYDSEHLKNTICFLAEANNISLRGVEQLFSKVNLVLLSTKDNNYLYPALLAFLLVVKEYNPSIYNSYVRKGEGLKDMIDLLHSMVVDDLRYKSFISALIEGLLISAKAGELKDECAKCREYHQGVLNEDGSYTPRKEYSETVLNVMKAPGGGRGGVNLYPLVEKIEMLAQFEFSSEV